MRHAVATVRRWSALALLGVGLGACASLSGSRQVLSFDSQPRGVEVQDQDGHRLGVTPFFAQVARQRQQRVVVVRPTAPGHRERFAVACSYRWWSSLLPNAALGATALAGGPLAVAALFGLGAGVDLWTGAAWDCPLQVQLPVAASGAAEPPSAATGAAEPPSAASGAAEPPSAATSAAELADAASGAVELAGAPTEPSAAPTCRLVVVVPPPHADAMVSQRLADQVWQQHRRGAPCDQRVDAETAEKLMRRLGISHDKPLQLGPGARRVLAELGWRTGAGYGLAVAVRADGDHLHAEPTLLDLHSLRSQPQAPLTLDLGLRQLPPWRRGLAWLGQHTQLLPDSLGFAPTWKTLPFTGAASGQLLSNQEAPSRLPSLASNWTLLSVEHPAALRPWDATWRVGPRVHFGYAARQLAWRDSADRAAALRQAEVTLLELGGLYEITGALHTPAGAFSLSLGGGWAGVWAWQGPQSLGWRVPFTASSGVAWTAFVTENLFLRTELMSYAGDRPRVQGPGYALREWTAGSVTLGWYVPEWRRWLRSLW